MSFGCTHQEKQSVDEVQMSINDISPCKNNYNSPWKVQYQQALGH